MLDCGITGAFRILRKESRRRGRPRTKGRGRPRTKGWGRLCTQTRLPKEEEK